MFSFSSNFWTKNAALIQPTASILTCMKGKSHRVTNFRTRSISCFEQDYKSKRPLSNHIFYFDNFFTSFDLMKVLAERSISASGTVRINRTNKCFLSTDDNLNNQDRGFYDYRMDSKSHIFAVVWKENNNVKMLSNHQGTLPAKKMK